MSGDAGKPFEGSQKAVEDVPDLIYDVALSPIRYEDLIDVWEREFGPVRQTALSQGKTLSDRALERHASRALQILTLKTSKSKAEQPSERDLVVDAFGKNPCVIIEPDLIVSKVNQAAKSILKVRVGDSVETLDTSGALAHAVQALGVGPHKMSALRTVLQNKRNEMVMLEARTGQDSFIVLTIAELGWSAALEAVLTQVATLSPAEMRVVRAVVEGQSVKDIATQRNRSVNTIRTQLRCILKKTETSSQTELIRLCAGLANIANVPNTDINMPALTQAMAMDAVTPVQSFTLKRPDRRVLEYLVFGDLDAATGTCLWMHQDIGLTRWPKAAEDHALKTGLRVIVPIRPGYGSSTPIPSQYYGSDIAVDKICLDFVAVLDAVGAPKVVVLSQAGASYFAFQFAARHPDRVIAIHAAAGVLPYDRPEQLARMHKWHRFIIANARYAPDMVPFMIKAGFVLACHIDVDGFGAHLFGGSQADTRTIAVPQNMAAFAAGTTITLSKSHTADDVYVHEARLTASDWSEAVRAATETPVMLYSGDDDPQVAPQTQDEWEELWPSIHFKRISDAGQLLFYSHWRDVLRCVLSEF